MLTFATNLQLGTKLSVGFKNPYEKTHRIKTVI